MCVCVGYFLREAAASRARATACLSACAVFCGCAVVVVVVVVAVVVEDDAVEGSAVAGTKSTVVR